MCPNLLKYGLIFLVHCENRSISSFHTVDGENVDTNVFFPQPITIADTTEADENNEKMNKGEIKNEDTNDLSSKTKLQLESLSSYNLTKVCR